MDFNNVRLLGYTHSSNFFGEDVFRYRTDKNLSLQGSLVDLTGANKISTGIWSGINYLSAFSDYEPIIINGTEFGSGRIESLSFEEGQDIDNKNYTADIIVYSSGNMSNMTGEYYTGIDHTNYRYINDLAEDFSYDTDGSEKTYTQRIAVSCFSGDAGNPLDLAKSIANHLFTVNGISGLLGNYSGVNTNPKYTENINLINNTYQVDKKVTLGNETGLYSIIKTHSITLGQDGVTIAEERGTVKGLDASDLWTSALNGVNYEVENAYDRCSQVFNAYKASSSATLNSKIVSLSKNLNKFNDTIDYIVSFDNKSANTPVGYSSEQTSEIIQNPDGIFEAHIKGVVRGWGVNYLQKFEAAKDGFEALKTAPLNFNVSASFLLSSNTNVSNIWPLSSSEVFSQFGGTVSYSYIYTTDYSYLNISILPIAFKKQQITVTDNYKNKHINRYGIFNQKEIVQKGSIYDPATRNLSLNLIGKRGWAIEVYLVRARDVINNYIPGGDLLAIDSFINDLNYTFDYQNSTLNLNITWEYTSDNPLELHTITEELGEVLVR